VWNTLARLVTNAAAIEASEQLPHLLLVIDFRER
jgi:hypothetical protein